MLERRLAGLEAELADRVQALRCAWRDAVLRRPDLPCDPLPGCCAGRRRPCVSAALPLGRRCGRTCSGGRVPRPSGRGNLFCSTSVARKRILGGPDVAHQRGNEQRQQGDPHVTNIVSIRRQDAGAPRPETYDRALRDDYGLTITQAAKALETSPSTIELWEAHAHTPQPCPTTVIPDRERARIRLERYVRDHGIAANKNLIFGVYPLRIARDILGLSVEKIASEYGYKPSTWQKLEANIRTLDREKLSQIEQRVREHFSAACG